MALTMEEAVHVLQTLRHATVNQRHAPPVALDAEKSTHALEEEMNLFMRVRSMLNSSKKRKRKRSSGKVPEEPPSRRQKRLQDAALGSTSDAAAPAEQAPEPEAQAAPTANQQKPVATPLQRKSQPAKKKRVSYAYYGGRLAFISTHPHVAEEWHPTKNADLVTKDGLPITPDTITPGSHVRAWWRCKKAGHEWQAKVFHRTNAAHPAGCPYCAGKRRKDETLSRTHPALAAEWNDERNKLLRDRNGKSLTPESVTAGSHAKVWWKCQRENHEWQARVCYRASARNPAGCPCCAGTRVRKEPLCKTHPQLAREWHPTKNKSTSSPSKARELSPDSVTAGSDRLVWWLCPRGHEWSCKVYQRASRVSPHDCPTCMRLGFAPSAENESA